MLPTLTKAITGLAAASEFRFLFVNRGITKFNPVLLSVCQFRGFVAPGAQNCLRKYKTIEKTSGRKGFTSQTHPTYSPELELNSLQFERISEDTLESLTEYFDQLIEQAGHLQDADVSYGDGVLTIHFGNPHGSYVINRQSPNKQIWLSSPKSGPKRYDFSDGKWIYKHDGKTLHELLNEEIPAIIRNQVEMEIMEDGNLVDRVRVLLQRDMEYYQVEQTVLREPLCVGVCGGRLDFPRHASFAAIKIVTWWEVEFTAAFKRTSGLSSAGNLDASAGDSGAVVKNLQPSEFVMLLADTAEQLLEHLHALAQEALDHADLTVLTATLGAGALVRNCLWCYNQQIKNEVSSQSSLHITYKHRGQFTWWLSGPCLQRCMAMVWLPTSRRVAMQRLLKFARGKMCSCYKSFQEMAEALAERLLDLHCRLISLYILNEADSINLQSNKPFFEKERCSFMIQMWWLYMQGTREDLWNTVPPKMAQRIFSGILNESLTIISARFIHGRPSMARSEQHWADAYNVLCCAAHLALSACTSGRELAGFHVDRLSIVARDIHAKCSQLLVSLLLRGTPFKILYQVFRDGWSNLTICSPGCGPAPWFSMSAPHSLLSSSQRDKCSNDLLDGQAIAFELIVLRAQPQPDWQQLINVLLMRNCKVSKLLFNKLVRDCAGREVDTGAKKRNKVGDIEDCCGGFLCSEHACHKILRVPETILCNLIHITIVSAWDPACIIVPALEQDTQWFFALERQQVWNQIRPPWLNALLEPLYPMMVPIVETLVEAMKTGASCYQAMSLVLACFGELNSCTPFGVLLTALTMNDSLPAHCHPIAGSAILQLLCAALYSVLLSFFDDGVNLERCKVAVESRCRVTIFDPNDMPASAMALAEALCSIDEDDKHTAEIEGLLDLIEESMASRNRSVHNADLESVSRVVEMFVDELSFTYSGQQSLKTSHEFLMQSSDWVMSHLGVVEEEATPSSKTRAECTAEVTSKPESILHTMFHIGHRSFDEFMTGFMETDWPKVLRLPLSITMDYIRGQILSRPEFKFPAQMTVDEREAAEAIKQLCAPVKSNHLN